MQTAASPHVLSFRRLLFLCGLLVLADAGRIAITACYTGEVFDRVQVVLTGLTPAEVSRTVVWSDGPDGRVALVRVSNEEGVETREVARQPSHGLTIELPASAVRSTVGVEVRVGYVVDDRFYRFPDGQWAEVWSPAPVGGHGSTRSFIAPESLRGPGSRLRQFDGLINWGGDGRLPLVVLVSGLYSPWPRIAFVLLLIGFAWSAWAGTRPDRLRVADEIRSGYPPAAPTAGISRAWAVGGFAVVAVALGFLEAREPVYFVQDDNHSQFLPVVLYSAESLERGVFPVWNPYQQLGAPTASVGVYALTYPPTFLSYAVAKHVFGRPEWTFEVFCVFHTLLGYWACYWAGREVGLRPALAAMGAVACTLSGFQLIAGRSWYYMTPFMVYLPLLVVSVERLTRLRRPGRWVLGTGFTIGLFFHAGNAQMWAYGVGAWGAAVLGVWAGGRVAWRRAAWAVPAGLLGLAIVAPLLVVQLDFLKDVDRVGGSGGDASEALAAVLFPYPVGQADAGWAGPQAQYAGEVMYAGTVFAGAVLAAVPLFLMAPMTWAEGRALLARRVWLCLAVLSFVSVLGHAGVLWTGMSVLPLTSKFNIPMKFIALFNLFAVLAGGQVIEIALARLRRPAVGLAAVAGAFAVGMTIHVVNCFIAFYWFPDRPYPAPTSQFVDLMAARPGRLLAVAPDRSELPGFPRSCRHNWPTVFRFVAVSGYDPLVRSSAPNLAADGRIETTPVRACREYGIRWFVVHPTATAPVFSSNRWVHTMEKLHLEERATWEAVSAVAVVRAKSPDVEVWELPDPRPMAFPVADPNRGLPWSADARGVRVDLTGVPQGGRVVANFLWRRDWKADADGAPVAAVADDWGRLVADVPAGTKALTFTYSPPWKRGFTAAAGLVLAALGCTLAASRFCRVRQTDEPPSTPAAREQ